jgi:hypothetical protein
MYHINNDDDDDGGDDDDNNIIIIISCMAVATEVGISPASVYHILTNSLGK